MPFYTTSNIRSTLKQHRVKIPEIYAHFISLPKCEQEEIIELMRTLSQNCNGLGPVGALELIYKVGRWMHNHETEI